MGQERVSRTLSLRNLGADLPVAWTGRPTDDEGNEYMPVDLFVGHPGRVREESLEDDLCVVGTDLFVDWHLRSSESGTCLQFNDVEVITEDEYAERVTRMNRGLAPLPGIAEGRPVYTDEPGTRTEDPLEDRTSGVRVVLGHLLLSRDFPGQLELLVQLGTLRVVGGPATFNELEVAGGTRPAPLPDGPVPGTAWVEDPDGRPVGTLVAWISSGYLSALEYAWVTDDPPTALPRVERIRVEHES
jgi:hypothetical protein